MRSKTTITVETVKQFRILHASHEIARLCPFCGAETAVDPDRSKGIVCEVIENATDQNNREGEHEGLDQVKS